MVPSQLFTPSPLKPAGHLHPSGSSFCRIAHLGFTLPTNWKTKTNVLRKHLLTEQAEIVFPSLVSCQHPPLLISHLPIPEAVHGKCQSKLYLHKSDRWSYCTEVQCYTVMQTTLIYKLQQPPFYFTYSLRMCVVNILKLDPLVYKHLDLLHENNIVAFFNQNCVHIYLSIISVKWKKTNELETMQCPKWQDRINNNS